MSDAADRAARDTEEPGASEASLAMLRQLLASLSALLALCPEPAPGSPEAAARDEIAAIASAAEPGSTRPLSWREARRAEQLITALLPWPRLRAELIRRVAEAKALGLDAAEAYAAELAALLEAAPPDEAAARALLLRVLDDVQWHGAKKIEMRRLAALQLRRLIAAFAGAVAVVVAAILFMPVLARLDVGMVRDGTYAGFVAAALAGVLGAGFSALRSSGRAPARSIEDMEIAASRRQIALRLMVGGGAAAVLYFFFQTGLLKGAATPDLARLGFDPLSPAEGDGVAGLLGASVPNRNLSLLVVWSFVAGFSEMLVPNLLAKVSGAADLRAEKSGGG